MHPYAFLFAARGDQAKTGRSFDFCYEGNGEYAPPAFLPMWGAAKSKPLRMIEEPTEIQSQILKAFGHAIIDGRVLQKTDP